MSSPANKPPGGEELSASQRLDSWKEIAAYLKRDVRTVRRWEKSEGLPVRRHIHNRLATVYAYKAELDAWWMNGHERLEALKEHKGSGSARRWAALPPWLATPTLLVAAGIVLAALAGLAGYYAFWQPAQPTAAVAPLPRTLAVTPFRNVKADAELDYLSLALADIIAGRLSYESHLAVRPFGAWLRNRDPNPTLQHVARELRVELVLTASFARDDKDDLHVTAELAEMPKGTTLWHGNLKAGSGGLMGLQQILVDEVAAALGWQPRRSGAAPVAGPGPGVGTAAQENLLRAVDAQVRRNHRAAIQFGEKALRLDPQSGQALAHLAFAYLAYRYEESESGADRPGERADLEKALALYQKAFEMGGASPAHLSLSGLYLMELGRLDEAVGLLRHAVRLNPNHAEAHWWLSQAYRYGGMLEESLAEAQLALHLDPGLRESSTVNTYLYLGEYDKFLESLPQTNLFAGALFYRGLAYYTKREFTRADTEFARAYELQPSLIHAQYGQALRFGMRGEREKALALLRQLDQANHPDGEMRYKLAQAYAALSDEPAALRTLRSAVNAKFICHDCFVRDPLLETLQHEPEYHAILQQAREQQEAFRKKFF